MAPLTQSPTRRDERPRVAVSAECVNDQRSAGIGLLRMHNGAVGSLPAYP
jgi:hypothetical protein